MSDKGLRYMPLHSNLVIFKSNIEKCSKINSHLYIPIWLYSNADRIFESAIKLILYIPIWFYSNCIAFFSSSICKYFTFQSGSIQIFFSIFIMPTFLAFTFQSGSIQIYLRISQAFDLNSLHSNLVLFK